MRLLSIFLGLVSILSASATTTHLPSSSSPTSAPSPHHVSLPLFNELEELSRLVDIAYCVGTTGIAKPFTCASRCSEFPTLELVSTFNTGPLLSDSCGYVAVDHGRDHGRQGRILVAFRGTYSIANTIVDLSTVPQEYVPYPGNDTQSAVLPSRPPAQNLLAWISALASPAAETPPARTCTNCTVHTGFWTSWQNTRPLVLPHLEALRARYPGYALHLVGHSLGGAVAALAGLDLDARGWRPSVTTFGEPRVGNAALRDWIDAVFALAGDPRHARYRRVTHVDDPVPLLPLEEWGYRAHAGEVYIAKAALQPAPSDIRLCLGDEDPDCLAGAANSTSWFGSADRADAEAGLDPGDEDMQTLRARWGLSVPPRYRMWQLFFAHRDYFWRLGLCVPGGDPYDWGRDRYGRGGEEPVGDDGEADQREKEL
jgi:pimeloyl-ACP methyl ester carboxylesterase